jgi:hypothetical protein
MIFSENRSTLFRIMLQPRRCCARDYYLDQAQYGLLRRRLQETGVPEGRRFAERRCRDNTKEGWRNRMIHRGWIFAAVLACASVPLAIAQFGPAVAAGEQYVPQLGDIMNAAQTRHIKLYFAGKAQNWDLADYELQKLRTNLAEAAVLYEGIPVNNVTMMVEPLKAVEDAIKAKDARRFASTVGELTDGCNTCHRSMNRNFITIRQPTEQPFSDQSFAPPGKK